MKLYKYTIKTYGNIVSQVITNDPAPIISKYDTFNISGDIFGSVIKISINDAEFSRITQVEISIMAENTSERLVSFVVFKEIIRDNIPTEMPKTKVFVITDSEGNILDRHGNPNTTVPKVFSRKSDATNSLNYNKCSDKFKDATVVEMKLSKE